MYRLFVIVLLISSSLLIGLITIVSNFEVLVNNGVNSTFENRLQSQIYHSDFACYRELFATALQGIATEIPGHNEMKEPSSQNLSTLTRTSTKTAPVFNQTVPTIQKKKSVIYDDFW